MNFPFVYSLLSILKPSIALFLSDLTSSDPLVWLTHVFWLTIEEESGCVVLRVSHSRTMAVWCSSRIWIHIALLFHPVPSQYSSLSFYLSSTPILTQTQRCVDVPPKWLLKIYAQICEERERERDWWEWAVEFCGNSKSLYLSHLTLTGLVCFMSVKKSVWRVFVCVCSPEGQAEARMGRSRNCCPGKYWVLLFFIIIKG